MESTEPSGNGQAKPTISDRFHKFACTVANWMGQPWAFVLSVTLLLVWAISGPFFGFSETWQLIINTATTIVTFLMVFLIQNTQNRDTEAMQLKLDELIRALQGAHNALLDLEELDDATLAAFKRRYCALASQARVAIEKGGLDTDTPET